MKLMKKSSKLLYRQKSIAEVDEINLGRDDKYDAAHNDYDTENTIS